MISRAIAVPRGEGFFAHVEMTESGVPFAPREGERVRLILWPSKEDSEPVLVKDVPPSTMIFSLTPEDTGRLPTGSYTYGVELVTGSGETYVFVPDEKIEVTE